MLIVPISKAYCENYENIWKALRKVLVQEMINISMLFSLFVIMESFHKSHKEMLMLLS